MTSQANRTEARHKHLCTRLFAIAAAASFLAACDTGGGVGIASGQNPDPVAVDFAIAYVKRPIPVDANGDIIQSDIREVFGFDLGANLYTRDRAAVSGIETNITFAQIADQGDVRDPEISYDGNRVLFTMRGPADPNLALDDPNQPTWNIWEYDFTTAMLRRIITSDITAEAGQDLSPQYLPDERIIFTSTRQRQSKAILLDESKPQFDAQDEDRNEPSFVLHVMNPDGSDIRQISFNQNHDLDPAVLDSGQIVFTRWDNTGPRNDFNLYRTNPDGTDLELLYGAMSHATGSNNSNVQFVEARLRPDGYMSTLVMPFVPDDFGGDVIRINTTDYIENTQPTLPGIGVLSGPAQLRATINNVMTDDPVSPGGRFQTAFPLWDGPDRMFVSWTQCLLEDPTDGTIVPCTTDTMADPTLVPAFPAYGIWLYDGAQSTQRPVIIAEQGLMITDIVAAQPRPSPAVIVDKAPGVDLDAALVAEGAGIINIRSVYDIDGVDASGPGIPALADPMQFTADQRPARFLRIVKAVSLPDEDFLDFDNSAFGVSQANAMKEIIGYTMVEPDGSSMFKVPANTALWFTVLDANGRRITQRHQNWIQVRPGEVLECNGCHNPGSGLSHGRRTEAFASANAGAPVDGVPFTNTEPALSALFGESMAETRSRHSCINDNCSSLTPNVNLVFDDVWTNPAVRAKDPSFAYNYSGLASPSPTSAQCMTNWTSICRIVLNYEQIIHPIWGVPRQTFDAMGNLIQDDTCITCHAPVDAMAAAMVPAGQLDLTNGISNIDADHFKSYRELLSGDNEQEVVMGVLVDRLIQIGIDPITMLPILVTVPVAPSMSVGGANNSGRFMSRFVPGGTHFGRLTNTELKLVSEWLDIGAQYYNDPFVAPLN